MRRVFLACGWGNEGLVERNHTPNSSYKMQLAQKEELCCRQGKRSTERAAPREESDKTGSGGDGR